MSDFDIDPVMRQQEPTAQPEHRFSIFKARQIAARLAVAAVCIIPPADLATSDAISAKVYQLSSEHIDTGSDLGDTLARDGILSIYIMGQSMALGTAIMRTRKLKGAFNDYEEYSEEAREKMSKPRKALSKFVNSPFWALEKIGNGVEFVGNKIKKIDSKIARKAGQLTIDAAEVNVVGTSTVIMEETLAGNPPDQKRNAYLAALITGSWILTAEALTALYNKDTPVVRPIMDAGIKAYTTLTDVNLSNPLETPVATGFLGTAAALLAVSGWRVAKYHEEKERQASGLSPADAAKGQGL